MKSKEKVHGEMTKPMLGVLSEMEVGETHSFPAEKTNSVKTMCSTFGFQWGKEFKTSVNRVNMTLDVTRVS